MSSGKKDIIPARSVSLLQELLDLAPGADILDSHLVRVHDGFPFLLT